MKTTIGILGASSQVGSSIALFLKDFPDIRVLCFIRSGYSQVFFDLLGLEYQYLDSDNEPAFREQIGSLDVVLDFRYPAVQMHEILDKSRIGIERVMKVMKPSAMYFYMSSIMAYGMPDNEKWIRNYRIPRSSYAYIKRALEKFVVRRGRRYGLKTYNFRLGQVHGFLQSVNGSFRQKLAETNIALIDGEPDDPVNIIFIHPLCEAIDRCVKGDHPPGLYTLVSEPQWSLRELYSYYQSYCPHPVELAFKPGGKKPQERRSFVQRIIGLVRPYRALAETYILMRMPALTVAVKGRFRKSELASADTSATADLSYIDFNLLGRPSLSLIPGLTVSPEKVGEAERKMEQYYQSVILAARK